MHNFKCKFCGKDSVAKRSDAIFCCAICRSNNNSHLRKAEVIAYKKAYYQDNKQKIDALGKERYASKKQKLEDRVCKKCVSSFSPTRKNTIFCSRKCGVDFWRANNKDHSNQYFRDMYANNLGRKLSSCLRSRLSKALKTNIKSNSTTALLGCSIDDLKNHLETLFKPGMTWNNYGLKGWHIDHIVPLCSFDLSDSEQVKIACNYKNLQPLWAKENLSKGGK
jgi:hypothetical protein